MRLYRTHLVFQAVLLGVELVALILGGHARPCFNVPDTTTERLPLRAQRMMWLGRLLLLE